MAVPSNVRRRPQNHTRVARVLAALLLIGCASDDANPEAPDAGDTECPLVASTCPTPCQAVRANRLTGTCTQPSTTIACYPADRVITADVGCIKNAATGDIYALASGGTTYSNYLPQDPTWTNCSPAEATKVSATSLCP